MRQLFVLLVATCAVACGSVRSDDSIDANNVTVDAPIDVDAPATDAQMIDAQTIDAQMIDAPTDAPPCPDGDGDTICDVVDVCPGHDDRVDTDGDTVPNGCDLCPGANDRLDTDSDGIPDRCPLSVLLVDGYGSAALAGFLNGWGMTVTVVPPANIIAGYNFAPYDVIAVMYDTQPAAPGAIVAASNAGKGVVVHRGDSLVDDFDMGSAGFWQSDGVTVTNNTHFITRTLPLGPVDVSYMYQSRLDTPSANIRVLASSSTSIPTLAVHSVYRRVLTPYYGHDVGMPWSNEGAVITWRSYIWAAGRAPL